MRKKLLPIALVWLFLSCDYSTGKVEKWQLLGFVKVDSLNPIMEPDTASLFMDPIRMQNVRWEGKDVFNPATLVMGDSLVMLYRAEDFVGKYNGTSRIGLAVSRDGLTFKRERAPVFYPDHDDWKHLEWEGGAEDPRIVEDGKGGFIMTYTAYDGELARLLVASSPDLRNWAKHGPAFKAERDTAKWSKSGSIVVKMEGSRMVATRIDGRYWMYFGDTDIFLASSSDLVTWEPLRKEDGEWKPVLRPRKWKFDSQLVEPGPPAILTKKGILLIYNSRNQEEIGDKELPDGTYAAGQALFDTDDPSVLWNRSEDYFFHPTKSYEMTGQVNNVCFIEGLSWFQGRWFLYYGTADSKIAVAVSDANLQL